MNDLARFALATRLYEAPKKNLDPKTLRAYIEAAEEEIMRLRLLLRRGEAKPQYNAAKRDYMREYMREYRKGLRRGPRADPPITRIIEVA